MALDVRAYNIALRACHTPGKTLRQEQLMQASESGGVGAPLWGQWCMQGSWELAACGQLLQEAVACSAQCSGSCLSPLSQQAFAIYEEMKKAGLAPDTITFGTLFSLCAAARQGHCALQV